jgi:hypothetical protein
MVFRITTVHDKFCFVLEQLCQLSRLSQFCQLNDIIDFKKKTLMALGTTTVHENDAPEPG